MNHWLVKQEPEEYSWADFERERGTLWTGVRNFQARNALAAMRRGDRVLFYHSGAAREVAGVAEVAAEARPDPTSEDPRWVAVELRPLSPLPRPVPLAAIKAEPSLATLPLLRQPRLSVMPIPPEAFEKIAAMGGLGRALSTKPASRPRSGA